MRRTAQPLPGSDYRWQDAAGFGLIQPDACLAEIHKPFRPVDLDKNHEARVFHASDGDCLLLSSSDSTPRRILIDGGRSTSYQRNTRDFLGGLRTANEKIDVVCVSHIDDDHITGILQLVEDEVDVEGVRVSAVGHSGERPPRSRVRRRSARSGTTDCSISSVTDLAPTVEGVLESVATAAGRRAGRGAAGARVRARRPRDRRASVDGAVAAAVARAARHPAQPARRTVR